MDDTTPVMFRKWPDGGIIALFPTLSWTRADITSYMHVGQHGGADYTHVVNVTVLAKPAEYADLLHELKHSVGYQGLVVRKVRTPQMREACFNG